MEGLVGRAAAGPVEARRAACSSSCWGLVFLGTGVVQLGDRVDPGRVIAFVVALAAGRLWRTGLRRYTGASA